jgi:putative transposase
MIVCWQASRSLRTDLALHALEQAIWTRPRAGADLDGLVHHSHGGVQYLALRYSERLAANGVVTSVGSGGDSYDNALAESIIGVTRRRAMRARGRVYLGSVSPLRHRTCVRVPRNREYFRE